MVSPLTPKQRSAIERALRLPDLQPLLFNKAKGLSWLDGFGDAGFLASEKIPRPVPADKEGYVSIPVWPIVNYLANICAELEHPENLVESQRVLDFIRNTSSYAAKNGISNYRVWWQFAKVLASMPPELLRLSDAEMADAWIRDPYDRGLTGEVLGEKLLPKLFKNKTIEVRAIALSLLDSLYRVQFVPGRGGALSERKEASLQIDTWHAEKITKRVAYEAGASLGKEGLDFFRVALQSVLDTLQIDQWCHIWRPAIEDHEQNAGRNDPEHILVTAFRDALVGYIDKAEWAERVQVVKQLLESSYVLVGRTVLHVIDVKFSDLRDFENAAGARRFYSDSYRHELWHFLNRHYGALPYDLREEVSNIILNITDNDGAPWPYMQAVWLSAIRTYEKTLQEKYNSITAQIGIEPDHPDFAAYMSSGWIGDESPVDPTVLQAMTIHELETTLNTFKDSGSPLAPNKRGLAKAFHALVKASPILFADEMARVLSWDLAYVYEALDVYRELWEETAPIPWDKLWDALLPGVLTLVEGVEFWSSANAEPQSSFVGNRHWVIGAAARLIESGTKSDDRAFSPALIPVAQRICLSILQRQEGEEFHPDSDAVSISINSPRGKTLEAMIGLARMSCRLEKKLSGTTAQAWANYENFFQDELEQWKQGNFEFATLVTNYLPSFLFMSTEWVKKNLPFIFNRDSYQAWLCAMQGYAYIGQVYETIYRHLAATNQLFSALDEPQLKERVSRTIVQQIVVAYLNSFERLDEEDGAIRKLLVRCRLDEIVELVWYVWTLRPEKQPVDKDLEAKVFSLWQYLVSQIDTSTKDGRKIASHLCDWIAFVEQINESTRPLIEAVLPWTNEDFRTYELLTSIARISRAQPLEAAELWTRMLKVSHFDFPPEAVDEALGNIACAGQVGLAAARRIADEYLRSGNERVGQLLKNPRAAAPSA